MKFHTGEALTSVEIVDLLDEARARTLLLVSTLSEEDVLIQHDPLKNPFFAYPAASGLLDKIKQITVKEEWCLPRCI